LNLVPTEDSIEAIVHFSNKIGLDMTKEDILD